MCKVFAMTNMSKVKMTKKFLNSVRLEVCRTGDKHGFGYATLSNDGKIAGERTMRPAGFEPMQENPENTETGKLSCILKTRDQFGTLDFSNMKSFIAHGRYSTNDVALQNTHPFVNDNVALIHNGVVYDNDGVIEPSALKTTNDTEIILRCWERGGMKLVENTVSGYYALAILDKTGLLHIVRDDSAMLYVAWVKTVDSYIFATTPEIIKNVAKTMKWQVEQPEEMLENVHVIWDGNVLVKQNDITPRKSSYGMTSKASAALGNGFNRSYSGHSTYQGYNSFDSDDRPWSPNIVDATKDVPGKKEQFGPDLEEPSYRESARTPEFRSEVLDGEVERQYIDDGAPNVNTDAYFNESEDGAYESAYADITGRKIS